MSHIDICGPGTLIDIYSHSLLYDEEAVVRWCSKCGAIVVDIDVDARTYPGRIMAMKFPANRVKV